MAAARVLTRRLHVSSATTISSTFVNREPQQRFGSALLLCRLSNHQPSAPVSTAAMNAQQKYLFDTLGYCVLRGALSPEEVAAANSAIDNHAQAILERNDPEIMLSTGSSTLKGNGKGRYDLGGMLGWPSPDNKVRWNCLKCCLLIRNSGAELKMSVPSA